MQFHIRTNSNTEETIRRSDYESRVESGVSNIVVNDRVSTLSIHPNSAYQPIQSTGEPAQGPHDAESSNSKDSASGDKESAHNLKTSGSEHVGSQEIIYEACT